MDASLWECSPVDKKYRRYVKYVIRNATTNAVLASKLLDLHDAFTINSGVVGCAGYTGSYTGTGAVCVETGVVTGFDYGERIFRPDTFFDMQLAIRGDFTMSTGWNITTPASIGPWTHSYTNTFGDNILRLNLSAWPASEPLFATSQQAGSAVLEKTGCTSVPITVWIEVP
jgi:hypothetical protein